MTTRISPDTLDVPAFHAWQRDRAALYQFYTTDGTAPAISEELYQTGHTLTDLNNYVQLIAKGTPTHWADQWLTQQPNHDYMAVDKLWEDALLYDRRHNSLKRVMDWVRPHLKDHLVNRRLPTGARPVLDEQLLHQCALDTLRMRGQAYITNDGIEQFTKRGSRSSVMIDVIAEYLRNSNSNPHRTPIILKD